MKHIGLDFNPRPPMSHLAMFDGTELKTLCVLTATVVHPLSNKRRQIYLYMAVVPSSGCQLVRTWICSRLTRKTCTWFKQLPGGRHWNLQQPPTSSRRPHIADTVDRGAIVIVHVATIRVSRAYVTAPDCHAAAAAIVAATDWRPDRPVLRRFFYKSWFTSGRSTPRGRLDCTTDIDAASRLPVAIKAQTTLPGFARDLL
jgi:hypothetical protein